MDQYQKISQEALKKEEEKMRWKLIKMSLKQIGKGQLRFK